MLTELLKLQQTNKSSNDIKITPELNKSISVVYGLTKEAQAQDWLWTVNGVANFHRWPNNFKLYVLRKVLDHDRYVVT